MRHSIGVAVFLIAAVFLQASEIPANPLSGTARSIDGKKVKLDTYEGKVIMVVNVASHCGYTKQYKQLQELQNKYGKEGFIVLAFPCNQFGKQEPGTDGEIQAFCEKKYSVSFPLFSKIEVNGKGAAKLYKYLTSDQAPIKDQGPVKWNFEKFLIDRKGNLINRYRSSVKPDAPNVIKDIQEAIAE